LEEEMKAMLDAGLDTGCWLERSGNPAFAGILVTGYWILDAGWSEAGIPITDYRSPITGWSGAEIPLLREYRLLITAYLIFFIQ
jgi:hypothetical protein